MRELLEESFEGLGLVDVHHHSTHPKLLMKSVRVTS